MKTDEDIDQISRSKSAELCKRKCSENTYAPKPKNSQQPFQSFGGMF